MTVPGEEASGSASEAGRLRRLFGSLTLRVVALSTIWAVLALVVIAAIISTLFRHYSERDFDRLLTAHLYNLIGSVSVTDRTLTGVPNLGDQRFTIPGSGWYWAVEPRTPGLKGRLSSISLTQPLPVADRRRSALSTASSGAPISRPASPARR